MKVGVNRVKILVCVLILTASLLGQQTPAAKAAAGDSVDTAPHFDLNALDRAADPCVDFYQYACGTWLAKNPIPPDQSRWGRFNALQERNRAILREILEESSRQDPKRSAVEQKIGDYYASCMDTATIERKGTEPLKPDLDRIAGLRNKTELASEIAHLHNIGVNVLFSFGAGPDDKNSSQNIAQADQGGLGLPDRDYYLKEDEKSVEIRREYVSHIDKIFRLLGAPADKAGADAQAIMRIETMLAKAALDRISRRDPHKVYHKLTRQELAALSPSFDWALYLAGIGARPFDSLNVMEPEFFRGVESAIRQISLADWKTYMVWHLVHSEAPMLPARFAEEHFDFYERKLRGTREMPPRWKRCVDYTDNQLGEALGQKYVDRTFGIEGKQRTLEMVRRIEAALGEDIRKLDWMTPETKKQALAKLHEVTNKIGFPDKWRDYTALEIVRGDALGNAQRADRFEFKRQVAKIGTDVDPREWQMSPPTVNAYYDPLMNNINFPAGILQPPFYDNKMDDAVNFGAIGAVIGHELTHGFDDQGRQYDPKGNLRDWWTAADAKAFEERAQCFVDQYGAYTVAGGVHLKGKLTLGENTADNGGLRLAYMALMDALAGKSTPKIDGFSPEQRLFLGWGQIWCENVTEQRARMTAALDPHSPGRYRVNGVVSNMAEFGKAFACKEGQPMVRPKACRVW